MAPYHAPTSGPRSTIHDSEKGSKSQGGSTYHNQPPKTWTAINKGRDPGPKESLMRPLTLGLGRDKHPQAPSTPRNARDVVRVQDALHVEDSDGMDSDESDSSTEWATAPEDVQRAPTAPAKDKYPSRPANTTAESEDVAPTHQSSADEPDFMGTDTQARPPMSRTRDEQWTPGQAEPARESYSPQASTSTRGQDRGRTRAAFAMGLTNLDTLHPSTAWSQRPSGPHMFTNAKVKISGGTFLNIAHIHESESPALGGGPAFPIAVLGLQAVSLATRSHCPHCTYPLEPSPSIVYVALHLPSFHHEMKIIMAPLIVCLFINMWIHRRAIERH